MSASLPVLIDEPTTAREADGARLLSLGVGVQTGAAHRSQLTCALGECQLSAALLAFLSAAACPDVGLALCAGLLHSRDLADLAILRHGVAYDHQPVEFDPWCPAALGDVVPFSVFR